MNELHLFAGAGGGILGGMLLGHTCVCAVEIEPYCRHVLLQRQLDGILPRFPIWDDVKTFDGNPWCGKVDVVCGGFPCTDISVAGRRHEWVTGDITGSRSGLWREMARVIGEVRPQYVFVENTPTLVDGGLAVVLGDIAEMGYDARWGVLGADVTGLPHHRARLWLVANRSGKRLSRHSSEPIQRIAGISRKQLGRRIENVRNGPPTSEHFYRGASDGVADYMDQWKAIGNGQVPAVAALAWRVLAGES